MARPIVAALGNHGLVEVSLFSVALVAAMILGAGTDYAIFLMVAVVLRNPVAAVVVVGNFGSTPWSSGLS